MKTYIFKIFTIFSICFVIALSGEQPVLAQNVDFTKFNFATQRPQLRKAMRNLKRGDRYMKKNIGYNYFTALQHYLLAYELNSKNALLNYKIGICYLHSTQKNKAQEMLESAYKINPNVADDIHFYLGKAYHINHDFEKAILHFSKQKENLKPEQAVLTEKINREMAQCYYAQEMAKKPIRVFIDPVFNNPSMRISDYAPVVNQEDNTMYFTSRRSNNLGGKRDKKRDNDFYEDIYVSKNINGVWQNATNAGKRFNSKYHESIVNFSPDSKHLLYYGGYKGGTLYIVDLKSNGKWKKPKKLSRNFNTKYRETSACFSPDNKILYFTSDRPGGFGGLDIYYSVMDDKFKWSDPINMGAAINTPFDEENISLSPDGKTLYFSSMGHRNFGGFDIFKSTFVSEKWTEAENIGYPVNSADNDMYFTITKDLKRGYYSTGNSKNLKFSDIFMITFLGPEKPMNYGWDKDKLAQSLLPVNEIKYEAPVMLKTTPITVLKGTIKDEKDKTVVAANIELIDNSKNEKLASFASNPNTGEYLVMLPSGKNYCLAIKAEGYLFHSENFDIPSSALYQEVIKDILMKKIEVGKKIVLKNIFFDTGKFKLRPESYAELGILKQLLLDNPELKIEISGHTDNVGNAKSNQKLSQNRAKAVVDYLINEGISTLRLKYAGYGSTQPVATNKTAKGRQENRRTEFKILENK